MKTRMTAQAGRATWFVAFILAVGLMSCGQSQNAGVSNHVILTSPDAVAIADQHRKDSVRELTLTEFCKTPPEVKRATSLDAIRTSCSPKVLAKAAEATVFDKGNGLYFVIFPVAVQKAEICEEGASSNSVCGPFLQSDSILTTRIVAPV